MTPAGVIPRFKRFTVIGIFRAGPVLVLIAAWALFISVTPKNYWD